MIRRFIIRHRNDFVFVLSILLLVTVWHRITRYYENLTDDNIHYDKHVLIWTPVQPFLEKMHIISFYTFPKYLEDCEYSNCDFTADKHDQNIVYFDAIIFGAQEVDLSSLPWARLPHQKYVLASLENLKDSIPISVENSVYFYKNFFNWTWTYRLDSDILWRYFRIYDNDGNEVGPRINMHWLKKFKPLNVEAKRKLKTKNKAVVWIPSDCKRFGQKERKEHYVQNLKIALEKYNLTLDSYGACGENNCGGSTECVKMIKKDYYFYLAFENSFDVDYVTGKLLNAIYSKTVPVVLGGANYTRFLPPGSYLDARKLNPKQMAKTMRDIISNFTSYQEYFGWTNHYTYEETLKPELCNLCKALNDKETVEKVTVYSDMKKWWLET